MQVSSLLHRPQFRQAAFHSGILRPLVFFRHNGNKSLRRLLQAASEISVKSLDGAIATVPVATQQRIACEQCRQRPRLRLGRDAAAPQPQ